MHGRVAFPPLLETTLIGSAATESRGPLSAPHREPRIQLQLSSNPKQKSDSKTWRLKTRDGEDGRAAPVCKASLSCGLFHIKSPPELQLSANTSSSALEPQASPDDVSAPSPTVQTQESESLTPAREEGNLQFTILGYLTL